MNPFYFVVTTFYKRFSTVAIRTPYYTFIYFLLNPFPTGIGRGQLREGMVPLFLWYDVVQLEDQDVCFPTINTWVNGQPFKKAIPVLQSASLLVGAFLNLIFTPLLFGTEVISLPVTYKTVGLKSVGFAFVFPIVSQWLNFPALSTGLGGRHERAV